MTVSNVNNGLPSVQQDNVALQLSDQQMQHAEQAATVQLAADDILDNNDHNAANDRNINASNFEIDEDLEPDLDEDEIRERQLEEEKAKMKKQQYWNLAAAVGVVALAVIGTFAFSFAIAALVVGTTALEITVTVIVGGAAFAGAGLTLYFALIRPDWPEKMKVLNDDKDK